MSMLGPAGEGLNVSAFLAKAIEEDMSGRQALAAFRAEGFSMSNQAFRSLYGDVRDAVGSRDALQGLQYDAIPTGDRYTEWAAGEGDQYATFVTSYVRPVGSRDVETRYYTHVTDAPHTPADAVDAAAGYLSDIDQGNPAYAPAVHVGSVVTSMTRTVGR